jgi:hypothetical protein
MADRHRASGDAMATANCLLLEKDLNEKMF